MSLNTQYDNTPRRSKVFISYSHDSPQHKERVLKLSNRLRSEGIDCNIDQYEISPPEGWPRWMTDQIEEADYVLVVCTEKYEKRFKGKDEAGKGLGSNFEGLIITQEVYEGAKNAQFIPVIFSSEDSNNIPIILKGATRHNLDTEEVYNELYARLTEQKLTIKPKIGELRPITPRNLSPFISTQDQKGALVENNQKPMIGNFRNITARDQNSEIHKTFISPSTGMQFVLIPAGEFMMGSEESWSEVPVHKVTVKDSLYMGKYQVTQKQWQAVMGKNPSGFKGDDLPVEHISWNDIQIFITKLNENENTDKYRLPSEAEWEYTCRAGKTTNYCFGDNELNLGNYAWYNKNSGKNIHTIGQKQPNQWGLHDMHGNVWEWVQDRWHNDYKGAPSDGSAWEDGKDSIRVFRGGGHRTGAGNCCSSARNGNSFKSRDEDVGFRVLRTL